MAENHSWLTSQMSGDRGVEMQGLGDVQILVNSGGYPPIMQWNSGVRLPVNSGGYPAAPLQVPADLPMNTSGYPTNFLVQHSGYEGQPREFWSLNGARYAVPTAVYRQEIPSRNYYQGTPASYSYANPTVAIRQEISAVNCYGYGSSSRSRSGKIYGYGSSSKSRSQIPQTQFSPIPQFTPTPTIKVHYQESDSSFQFQQNTCQSDLRTRTECEFETKSDKLKKAVSKIELPKFSGNGIKPKDWIRKCEKYCKFNDISDNEIMDIIELFLENKAEIWYLSKKAHKMNWSRFCEALTERFSEASGRDENLMDSVMNIESEMVHFGVPNVMIPDESLVSCLNVKCGEGIDNCSANDLIDYQENNACLGNSFELARKFDLGYVDKKDYNNAAVIVSEKCVGGCEPISIDSDLIVVNDSVNLVEFLDEECVDFENMTGGSDLIKLLGTDDDSLTFSESIACYDPGIFKNRGSEPYKKLFKDHGVSEKSCECDGGISVGIPEYAKSFDVGVAKNLMTGMKLNGTLESFKLVVMNMELSNGNNELYESVTCFDPGTLGRDFRSSEGDICFDMVKISSGDSHFDVGVKVFLVHSERNEECLMEVDEKIAFLEPVYVHSRVARYKQGGPKSRSRLCCHMGNGDRDSRCAEPITCYDPGISYNRFRYFQMGGSCNWEISINEILLRKAFEIESVTCLDDWSLSGSRVFIVGMHKCVEKNPGTKTRIFITSLGAHQFLKDQENVRGSGMIMYDCEILLARENQFEKNLGYWYKQTKFINDQKLHYFQGTVQSLVTMQIILDAYKVRKGVLIFFSHYCLSYVFVSVSMYVLRVMVRQGNLDSTTTIGLKVMLLYNLKNYCTLKEFILVRELMSSNYKIPGKLLTCLLINIIIEAFLLKTGHFRSDDDCGISKCKNYQFGRILSNSLLMNCIREDFSANQCPDSSRSVVQEHNRAVVNICSRSTFKNAKSLCNVGRLSVQVDWEDRVEAVCSLHCVHSWENAFLGGIRLVEYEYTRSGAEAYFDQLDREITPDPNSDILFNGYHDVEDYFCRIHYFISKRSNGICFRKVKFGVFVECLGALEISEAMLHAKRTLESKLLRTPNCFEVAAVLILELEHSLSLLINSFFDHKMGYILLEIQKCWSIVMQQVCTVKQITANLSRKVEVTHEAAAILIPELENG